MPESRELVVLKRHKGRVCSVDFSYDDHFAVSAGLDGCAFIWSVPDGERLLTIKQKQAVR